MRYCKLIDNELVDVSFPLRGDQDIFTTDGDIICQYGYKPVVYTEQPDITDGEYITPIYTETKSEIQVSWEVHEIVVDSDYITAARILMGEEEDNAE